MLHKNDEDSFDDVVQLTYVPAPHEHIDWREWDAQYSEVQDTVFSDARLSVRLDPAAGWVAGTVPLIPTIIYEALSAIVVSGVATGLYQLLKTWIDARNGRKLKIKVGDIEVEATQMKEEDVFRIFELLEEKADRKKIRELLIATNQRNSSEGR